ncbi:MAG: universal stress protein [Acidobacteriia bacterium]|nr:universal stress protein [Terriglobia bacterium]
MAAPNLIAPTSPKLKNILFATDFSEASLTALPHASAVARAFAATLHLCHIEPAAPFSSGVSDPRLYEAAGKNATAQLVALRDLPVLKGMKPALVLGEGNLKDELLKIVANNHIDLLVAGTRGRTGLRKMLLGSVLEEICRVATCPILTVGPGTTFDAEAPFKSILYPTNLSELSKKALPYIALLARQYGSSVTVLHVVPEGEATTSDEKSFRETVAKKMSNTFGPALAEFHPEFEVAFGSTAETVLRVAEEKKVSLVALGIRNAFRPGVLRARTAYRIMAGAPCPVLTVP